LIVQMAKMLGAHVSNRCNQEKAKQAKEAGADEVIIYHEGRFQTAKAKACT